MIQMNQIKQQERMRNKLDQKFTLKAKAYPSGLASKGKGSTKKRIYCFELQTDPLEAQKENMESQIQNILLEYSAREQNSGVLAPADEDFTSQEVHSQPLTKAASQQSLSQQAQSQSQYQARLLNNQNQ